MEKMLDALLRPKRKEGMTMKQINAMGKVCPLPVIETKKALKSEDGKSGVEVMVDNEIATQNLSKMAEQMKLSHSVKKISDAEFKVTIGGEGEEPERAENSLETASSYVVAVGSEQMGTGEEELGKKLMTSFLYALAEQDDLPKAILFYNSGVRLTVEGSDSVEDLKALSEGGVEIVSCGLCLNYYDLTEKLAVGSVTNMYRITELLRTHHVVKP